MQEDRIITRVSDIVKHYSFLAIDSEMQLRMMLKEHASQVREALFMELRDAGRPDTKRTEYLDGIITLAIESGSAGNWMNVFQYDIYKPDETIIVENPDDLGPGEQNYADLDQHLITHSLIEEGLRRIRNASPTKTEYGHTWTTLQGLTNGGRLSILTSDLLNDAGEIGSGDALAVLEVALFNEVRYC